MNTIDVVLASMIAAIEALPVVTPASEDARYRCVLNPQPSDLGDLMYPRCTTIECSGSTRVWPGRICTEWRADVTVGTFYPDGPAQTDMPSQRLTAIVEGDAMCSALIAWAATATGVFGVISEQAPDLIVIEGGGIVLARTYTIFYDRS